MRGRLCAFGFRYGGLMKVSDVDIEIIHKLLKNVPQGMEIESIGLTNGYTLKLIAGTEELNAVEKQQALDDLINIIRNYDNKQLVENIKMQLP